MEKLLIVDGNSILNRAYYGIRMLNAPDGTPTNAIYGFLNILFKYLDEEMPDYLCVAFDVKEKTFRHKMYDLYKAQRKPAPEDFLVQIPVMKEVLGAMNCTCIEKAGYEADDLIGTVSRICEEKGIECSILTGDKDDLQLASKLVKVKLVVSRMGNTTTTVYDADGVYEKYGVTPSEFIDVKALMGDSSDNIPGVKGIGEKTAFSLIQKYKSIDEIYSDVDNLNETPSVKNKLSEGKDDAYLSKKLATIDRFVPFDFDVESSRIGEYNDEELAKLFTRLNFKSFLNRLNLSAQPVNRKVEFNGKGIEISEDELLAIIEKQDNVIYRMYRSDAGVDLAATANGEELYISKNVSNTTLKKFFEGNCKKTGFGVKDDILFLKGIGIEYKNLEFDVEIAAYILEPTRSSYDIEGLALEFLGISIASSENEDENGQFSLCFDEKEECDSFAEELFSILSLRKMFEKKLKENNQLNLYYNVELPLIEVLADMQYTGVFVDKGALVEFGNSMRESITRHEEKIYDFAGKKFNINSPKQLGEVLFVDLSLPHGKKTKTGYSTGVDVLKKLEGVHPIIESILEYRSLSKLMSTYVDGLLPVIDEKTGRIHSNFNQTVTATGRISSTEPNLQNIPVRTERGREMRKMFVAEGNKVLVDADYSQIELRVLAHIADDDNMRSAFKSGKDIHTQTASQVFKVPLDEVTPSMRSGAKAVNFGIVYGIGEFSLSQDLKISIKEAKQYITDYLETYPSIREYMKKTVEDGRENGYVSTIFNRRRYVPELRASNKITQAFGERVAMNAPVQGSAADIIKIAMVNVYKRLKNEGLMSKLILQVHDELIVEAELNEKEMVEKILFEEMENAAGLSVPLKVDLKSGKTWFETK